MVLIKKLITTIITIIIINSNNNDNDPGRDVVEGWFLIYCFLIFVIPLSIWLKSLRSI
jgi:hypothetical protein